MDVVAEIASSLESEIARLAPGERLPSEHDLMTRFGATRAAVRRAIDTLERRFLVRRSQGAGTFVNRRIDFVLSPNRSPSMHEEVAAAGSVARTFVVESGIIPAQEDIAGQLRIDPGTPVEHFVRLGYIDDGPATYAEEWISPDALQTADLGLRRIESLVELLRAAGGDPVRARSRVSAGFAPPDVATRFEAADPVPVWHISTLTTNGRGGEPLMYSQTWMRQDRVHVVVDYAAS